MYWSLVLDHQHQMLKIGCIYWPRSSISVHLYLLTHYPTAVLWWQALTKRFSLEIESWFCVLGWASLPHIRRAALYIIMIFDKKYIFSAYNGYCQNLKDAACVTLWVKHWIKSCTQFLMVCIFNVELLGLFYTFQSIRCQIK